MHRKSINKEKVGLMHRTEYFVPGPLTQDPWRKSKEKNGAGFQASVRDDWP
jgi:hypothetical protein